ncbi:MAG: hypothetical protein R2737_06525 [Candidatus Nanopelagicales bacterium]
MTTDHAAETRPAAGDEPESFEDLARRVDELRDRVRHADAGPLLDETVEAITAFNRAGLVTLVQLLRSDPRGVELLYRAVDEPEVMALFVAHGIVRADRTVEVLRAVEQLRPYLVASSIELDVVRVADDVAVVRYPTGCSAPAQEVKDEIAQVLVSRVPGLRAVEEAEAEQSGAFVPLTSLRVGPP